MINILLWLLELQLDEILNSIVFPIIVAIIIALISAIAYFSRKRISNWWFGRKVNPHINQAVEMYQNIVLPEYDAVKPKVKIVEEKSEMPSTLPFGFIFIL